MPAPVFSAYSYTKGFALETSNRNRKGGREKVVNFGRGEIIGRSYPNRPVT
jgi:hypothetical protein